MSGHEKVLLKVKRARKNGLPTPAYKTDGAACFDLSADLAGWALEKVTLMPDSGAWFPCGWHFEIPRGFEMQVRGRSGLAYITNVIVHHFGTIDCDYRGEVMVGLWNFDGEPFDVTHGMRIAQAKIERVVPVSIVEAENLSETRRGAKGFGSTGSEP